MRFSAPLVTLALLGVSVTAQQPKPSFEVASIKRNQSNARGAQQDVLPGGRFVATNRPLTALIQFAYGVEEFQLDRVPDWARAERFDIAARAETDASLPQVQLMLRSLLEDRFRLVVRRETREIAVSALVLARSDGRLGPGLVQVPTDGECEAAIKKQPEIPPGARLARSCGDAGTLARLVGIRTKNVVVDKTGLTGTWSANMYYAPEVTANADSSLPSLVTALTEQLGLKLQPGRGPVEMLVIESVQRPTED